MQSSNRSSAAGAPPAASGVAVTIVTRDPFEADLEPIDLSDETDAPAAVAARRPVRSRPPTRRFVAAVAVAAVVLFAAAVVLAARPGSPSSRGVRHPSRRPGGSVRAPTASPGTTAMSATSATSTTTTAWSVPNGLPDLAGARYVAIVDGALVLVDHAGPHRLLSDFPRRLVLDSTAPGSALVTSLDGPGRVIVGPAFDGTRNVLPAAIVLVPDALGRWWSNYGGLDGRGELHLVTPPPGTTVLAQLRDGSIVADSQRSGLFLWRGRDLLRIGVGPARVIAVAGTEVAWTDDRGTTVHVANLATGRTLDVRVSQFALTARFSPDRSRIALLTSGAHDEVDLVDVATGRLLRRMASRQPQWVFAPDGLPPALLPVPFSWEPGGASMIVVTPVSPATVEWVDAATGRTTRTTIGPTGLQQIGLLAS